jgi:hypothetical protein
LLVHGKKRKGLEEFVKLIDNQLYTIVLVGLSQKQMETARYDCGIERTENVGRLADLYSAADVFFESYFEDTFPTTNLESLACGTL